MFLFSIKKSIYIPVNDICYILEIPISSQESKWSCICVNLYKSRSSRSWASALNYLTFQSFDFEFTWWKLFQKSVGRTKFYICVFITTILYHWVDTSAGGLLVPEGIIRPVVGALALTWFIKYTHYWNLQFLNNVSINESNVLLPQA